MMGKKKSAEKERVPVWPRDEGMRVQTTTRETTDCAFQPIKIAQEGRYGTLDQKF